MKRSQSVNETEQLRRGDNDEGFFPLLLLFPMLSFIPRYTVKIGGVVLFPKNLHSKGSRF